MNYASIELIDMDSWEKDFVWLEWSISAHHDMQAWSTISSSALAHYEYNRIMLF